MTKQEKETQKKVEVPADGEVIRGPDGAIHIMEAGKRRVIPDRFTYVRLGINAAEIASVTAEELEAIPKGAPIPAIKPRGRR